MPVMDGWETLERVKQLYVDKQADIDREKSGFTVVTLLKPYLAIQTATYVDHKTRQKAR